MKNFPQESFGFPEAGKFGHRRDHESRARHHHDPNSPTEDGDFSDRPGRRGHRGPGFGGRGFGGPGHGAPADGPGREEARGRFDGPGPGFGGPRGFGGPGPGLGGPGFGGRVRRGNVRSAILSLLSQHSFNGYGLIRAISNHTDGAWRPSPGSIYPALTALQAEGLIESNGASKRTEYALTGAGKAYVAENAAEMAQVWADVTEEAGAGKDLRTGMGKLVGAVQQISLSGTEEQIKTATEALDNARRTIYKLLAD